MLYERKEFRFDYAGKEVTIETGRLAKQADGAVLVSSGGTQVLVTVCSARVMKDGQDFFPLLVEYTEKFYAAGKFLGGFIKREGRPTTQETLNARLIDRPLRPLFPSGYMFDTVVSCTVISYSPDGDPDVLAGIGASAALSISDIPFEGPIATCKVGRIDGEYVLNPSLDQWANSDLDISVAGSDSAILMVEGEANIVPDKEVLEAIFFGHDKIKEFCEFLKGIQKEVGVPKREWISAAPNETLMKKVESDFSEDAKKLLLINEKMKRQLAVKNLEKKVAAAFDAAPADFAMNDGDSASKEAYKAVDELLYNIMRKDILLNDRRIANRKLNEVREIVCENDILKTPHGSSLFTRGETQVMATVTLGGQDGEQMQDRIVGMTKSRFYLHYNFPPYSVGEARGVRGVGRRELGHGNLAERALKAVYPGAEEFPYTARIVCEVLESNGSSSMASVCSGALAMLDAGVPLKSPVAGIAMGLITEGDNYKILTDILGDEDHLGDMDFKVAGTKDGITAIQMDIKIKGLTREIIETAMGQASEGRLHILGVMGDTMSTPREEFKAGVPRMKTLKINPDSIGALIGPGGKNIKALQENFEVKIEVTEEGLVKIFGSDSDKLAECQTLVALQINGPELGSVYDAKVVSIKDYGAFVDIAQGVSGLLHVSEISDERIKEVTDYIAEGDIIKVQVSEIDRMGRMKLSAKAVKSLPKKG